MHCRNENERTICEIETQQKIIIRDICTDDINRLRLFNGLEGSSWRSKAVILTAFCSSLVSLARLSVNVSAMRNSMVSSPLDQFSTH